MFNLEKNSVVTMVLVSFLLLLAACGANSSHASESSSPASSPTAPAADSLKQVELTVSAAASLTDALKEIQPTFEAANPDIKLSLNFGASGALQQQIEQGAPVDLFLSSAKKNMAALVDKQLIDEAHQANLLTNELVVVVPQDSKANIAGIADLTREELNKIAIGIPESVPAGNYAKEALTNARLWDALQPKLVQAKDVRQVLQYVETGNADAGFVYRTDAMTSDKSSIAFAVDPAIYTPVEYPIGIVKKTKRTAEAEALYSYLQSQAATDVFVKYGFSASAAP